MPSAPKRACLAYAAMALILASCAPVVSRRASDHAVVVTNRIGTFSCLRAS